MVLQLSLELSSQRCLHLVPLLYDKCETLLFRRKLVVFKNKFSSLGRLVMSGEEMCINLCLNRLRSRSSALCFTIRQSHLVYVDTGSEVTEPSQWSLDTDGCHYFQRPPYLSSSKSGVLKLVLDLRVLKIDGSNDWSPPRQWGVVWPRKIPHGHMLAPAELGAVLSFCSKKDIKVFLLQVWKQQLCWPVCRPAMICCALQGALFALQRRLCRRPHGRRLEKIVVHGICRRYFRWSEVAKCVAEVTFWRQVERYRSVSSECKSAPVSALTCRCKDVRQRLEKSLQHHLAASPAASEYFCSQWAWTDSSSYFFNAVQIVFVFQSGF